MSLVFCFCHSLSNRSLKLFVSPFLGFFPLLFVIVALLGRYVVSLLDSDSEVVSFLCTKLTDFLFDTFWLGIIVGVFGVDVA